MYNLKYERFSLLDELYNRILIAQLEGKDSITFPSDMKYHSDIHYIRSLLNHKFKKSYSLTEVYDMLVEEGLLLEDNPAFVKELEDYLVDEQKNGKDIQGSKRVQGSIKQSKV